MKLITFLLLLPSFLSIKQVFGNDKECMIKFKNCFMARNCESRVKSLDYFCCKDAFKNGTYEEAIEEECLDDRMLVDAYDCLEMLGENCKIYMASYFFLNEDNFTKIEDEMKIAIGEPESIEDCIDYAKRIEKEECLLCADKEDDDTVFGFICDIIRSTRKSSLYCTSEKKCMEFFSNCMASNITEAEINALDVTCCEKAFKASGDFYEYKDRCIEDVMVEKMAHCMIENEYYVNQIVNYFGKNIDLIDEFDKTVRDKTGIPSDVSQCNYYYEKEKQIILEECLLNKNKNLIIFCELLERILWNKDSSNYIQDTVENILKK